MQQRMSTEAANAAPGARTPFLTLFGSIRPYQRPWLKRDVVAGVTLAALAIPEVMGYTKIAGTPVITGLYTILIPILAFAVFGSSRHLVVGGDSATAAILERSDLYPRDGKSQREGREPVRKRSRHVR